MKKITLVFTLALLIASTATAQAPDILWTRIFDTEVTDYGQGAVFTSDEYVVIAGIHYIHNSPPYSSDVGLRKVDADGTEIWYKTYNYNAQDQAYTVEEAPDGGYVVFALTGPTDGGFDGFILKTDADGVEQWHQSYPVSGYEVVAWGGGILTADGGYLLAGSIQPNGTGDSGMDGMLMKIGSDGELEWYNGYGGAGYDQFWSVIQTSDGGYAACGLQYVGGDYQAWVLKVDEDGNEEWSALFGDSDDQECGDLWETETGSFLVCGDAGNASTDVLDGFIAKVGAEGDSLGFTVLDPLQDEATFLRAIEPVYDQGWPASVTGYCIYGYSQAAADDYSTSDLLLIGVGLDGEMDWYRELGTDEDEWSLHGITQAWDNGCVVVGNANYATTDAQAVYVARLDGPNMTGVHETPAVQPSSFTLDPPYPNPFNSTTVITFHTPTNRFVRISLFDVLGREIRVLHEGDVAAGSHRISLNGDGLASGQYFIRMSESNGSEMVRKVVLMK